MVAAPLLITGVGVLLPVALGAGGLLAVGLGAGGLLAVGLGAGGLLAADGTVTVPVSAPQPDKATTTTIIAAGSSRFTTIVDLR